MGKEYIGYFTNDREKEMASKINEYRIRIADLGIQRFKVLRSKKYSELEKKMQLMTIDKEASYCIKEMNKIIELLYGGKDVSKSVETTKRIQN